MFITLLTVSLGLNIILGIVIIFIIRAEKDNKKHFDEILDRTYDSLRIASKDLSELKKKYDKRPNSKELDEFITDMASSGKSILEVKRIDPSNLFIWNR